MKTMDSEKGFVNDSDQTTDVPFKISKVSKFNYKEINNWESCLKYMSYVVPVTEKMLLKNAVIMRILMIFERIIRILNYKSNGELEIKDTLDKLNNVCKLIKDNLYEMFNLVDKKIYKIFENTKYYSLIRVLRHQHNIGRDLIKLIEENINQNFTTLNVYISDYIYMYRAIISREDTIITGLVRKILTSEEFVNLSYEFRMDVYKLYGPSWRKNILEKIIDIERSLGIDSLSQFTPILDPKEQEFLNLKHFVID